MSGEENVLNEVKGQVAIVNKAPHIARKRFLMLLNKPFEANVRLDIVIDSENKYRLRYISHVDPSLRRPWYPQNAPGAPSVT
ncbi:MAG TPA: hypothetical protein VGD50_03825 [Candidatus Baltobacteraceae bacterium]